MLERCFDAKKLEAGVDEAGRGCLAGPVTAAAVILPRNFNNKILNDSKKLSKNKREELRIIIEENAVSWSVAFIHPKEIDKINILQASFKAMHEAIYGLSRRPEFLLIDGNKFNPYPGIDHECIVKGDGKFMSIAAASILAKTHRDEFMQKLHKEYPSYWWKKNKGYGTLKHRKAIAKHGPTEYHRRSFRLYPLPEQAEMVFS